MAGAQANRACRSVGMRLLQVCCMVSLAAACVVARAAPAPVDLAPFMRDDSIQSLKISPDGKHFAARMRLQDRTVLAILDRDALKVTGTLNLGPNTDVIRFEWINNERVLANSAQKFGQLDQPESDGQIYGINADNRQARLLVGQSVRGGLHGSMIQATQVEDVAATLIDTLPDDDRSVLVQVEGFVADRMSRVDRMDAYSGRRTVVTRGPVRNATFRTDNAGVVRFASGSGVDNVQQLFYRVDADAPWKLVNDESASGVRESPLGFSADNRIAYMVRERVAGPDVVVAWDLATDVRKDLLVDAVADPATTLFVPGTRVPFGVEYVDGVPRSAFFDAKSSSARLQKRLDRTFPGQVVRITSTTADGKLSLVAVYGDANPGDYYLFDMQDNSAAFVGARSKWIDRAAMARTKAFDLVARDGLPLHGFLTVPKGSDGKGLPMVVLPHGGPVGVHDEWGYDPDVQVLAAAGYAVLQVNFRGSDGFGRAFSHAGARQWGKAMQDDITDATRWAIAQGHADAARICIYGASYGAYAALMGVAREPTLYKCAAGYVGVYDLVKLVSKGEDSKAASTRTYFREWVGTPDELAAVSPNRLAAQIKVPVFLAAGGEDKRAPIEQTRSMEQALREAKVPVETLYVSTEGHGFYKIEHREAFYRQLLAFLSRNIGGATAAPPTGKH